MSEEATAATKFLNFLESIEPIPRRSEAQTAASRRNWANSNLRMIYCKVQYLALDDDIRKRIEEACNEQLARWGAEKQTDRLVRQWKEAFENDV